MDIRRTVIYDSDDRGGGGDSRMPSSEAAAAAEADVSYSDDSITWRRAIQVGEPIEENVGIEYGRDGLIDDDASQKSPDRRRRRRHYGQDWMTEQVKKKIRLHLDYVYRFVVLVAGFTSRRPHSYWQGGEPGTLEFDKKLDEHVSRHHNRHIDRLNPFGGNNVPNDNGDTTTRQSTLPSVNTSTTSPSPPLSVRPSSSTAQRVSGEYVSPIGDPIQQQQQSYSESDWERRIGRELTDAEKQLLKRLSDANIVVSSSSGDDIVVRDVANREITLLRLLFERKNGLSEADIRAINSIYGRGGAEMRAAASPTHEELRARKAWNILPENLGYIFLGADFVAALECAETLVRDYCGRSLARKETMMGGGGGGGGGGVPNHVRVNFAKLVATQILLTSWENPSRYLSDRHYAVFKQKEAALKRYFKDVVTDADLLGVSVAAGGGSNRSSSMQMDYRRISPLFGGGGGGGGVKRQRQRRRQLDAIELEKLF